MTSNSTELENLPRKKRQKISSKRNEFCTGLVERKQSFTDFFQQSTKLSCETPFILQSAFKSLFNDSKTLFFVVLKVAIKSERQRWQVNIFKSKDCLRSL